MPITFAVNSVVDRVRAEVLAVLTAVGEVPTAIPNAETAEQVTFQAADLPATILQMKSCKVSNDNCNVGCLRFCQPILIHHVRALDPKGSASDTATSRLAAIAAAIDIDFQLLTVSKDTDVPVEQVRITGLDRGEDNPVQMLLDASEDNVSLVAVVLTLEVDWVEESNF